jgi:hypothetical protein
MHMGSVWVATQRSNMLTVEHQPALLVKRFGHIHEAPLRLVHGHFPHAPKNRPIGLACDTDCVTLLRMLAKWSPDTFSRFPLGHWACWALLAEACRVARRGTPKVKP